MRPSPPTPRSDAYAAWRVPAFRRYLLAGQVVAIGSGAQGLAIGWEMYVRTDEPLALGLVGLVQAVPMLLLTLPAGYLADVFDRRRLMVVSMLLTSLTSVGLAVFSYLEGSILVMYWLLFLDSCAMRLGGPARTALVPLLVPRDVFENAVKWRTSLGQISGMVGPAVGGAVIAWSVPAAYALSAASTLAFIGVLMTLDIPSPERAAMERNFGGMVKGVAEGLRFVWWRRVLLGAISLDLFAVLLGGAVYLLPIYAKDILELEGTGLSAEGALGVLRAAPAAGALVMAVVLTHSPPFRRAGRTMLLAVAGFGLATIVFGFSTSLWLSLAMLALTGAMDNVSVVVRHTLVQLATPDAMRGRVSAVSSIFIGSSNEVGGFESGAVAQLFGAVASVVAGGVGTLVVVGVWAGLFPELRRVGRLAEVEGDETVV